MDEQSPARLWEPHWYESERLRLDGLVESAHECLARLADLCHGWDSADGKAGRRQIQVQIIEAMAIARAYLRELAVAIDQAGEGARFIGPWRADHEELERTADQLSQWMVSAGIR